MYIYISVCIMCMYKCLCVYLCICVSVNLHMYTTWLILLGATQERDFGTRLHADVPSASWVSLKKWNKANSWQF